MPEENQIGRRFEQPATPSLSEWTKQMLDFQNNTVEQKRQKFDTQNDEWLKNVFVNSTSTTNQDVSSECNKAFRIWLIAKWIRDFYIRPENWKIDYSNVEDVPLVDSFKDSNPDLEQYIWDFVLDDNQICDPTQIYYDLWFEQQPIEEETTEMVDEDEWFWWIWDIILNYVSGFYNHWWQAISNLINGSLEEIEQWTMFDWNPWETTDHTASALENYAQMNYWTNFYWLTEEQKAEARQAISTEEWMDMYEPTIQRVLSRWAEAWVDAYFSIAWWPIQLLMSVWSEIPYVQDIIEWFGSLLAWWGYIINQIPWLKQFRDSLQTEEEKRERDQYVAWFWLWKLSWKKWVKAKDGIWNGIIKIFSDPADIIKQFQKRAWETISWIWERFKLQTAWEALADMNKIKPTEKLEFEKIYKQPYWDYLNDLWIVEWTEWTIEKLQYNVEQNLQMVDDAINTIQWDFYVWNKWFNAMLDDVVSFAEATLEKPAILNKLYEIQSKFNSNGYKLSSAEVQYIKRYFESKIKLAYWKASREVPAAQTRVKNIDNWVREMLLKIAEDNWFDNMREINQHISKSKFILNALWEDMMRRYWNPNMKFSDVLSLLWLKWIPVYILKEFLKSNAFKKMYVNFMNKRTWFKPKDPINVDLDKIRQSNAEKVVQRAYDSAQWDWTPRLIDDIKWWVEATDTTDWVKWRVKDKPKPTDLVIETNKNTPWDVEKNVYEWNVWEDWTVKYEPVENSKAIKWWNNKTETKNNKPKTSNNNELFMEYKNLIDNANTILELVNLWWKLFSDEALYSDINTRNLIETIRKSKLEQLIDEQKAKIWWLWKKK